MTNCVQSAYFGAQFAPVRSIYANLSTGKRLLQTLQSNSSNNTTAQQHHQQCKTKAAQQNQYKLY